MFHTPAHKQVITAPITKDTVIFAEGTRNPETGLTPLYAVALHYIAEVCHNVNRDYCQSLGDFSQPVWDEAPQWQKDSAMTGVMLHVTNPDAGPQASHESWMAQKIAEGWVYGPEKNPELKTHHCLVPFDQLPVAQQAKDFIFRGIVHAMLKKTK